MKYTFLVLILLPFFCSAQKVATALKSDTSLYKFAIGRFINGMDSRDSIWLEGNNAYDYFMPKSVEGTRIKLIYPVDYIAYLKRKKIEKIIKMTPISFENHYFNINICVYKASYNKKERLFTFVNEGGINLKFVFDCAQDGFILVSETFGH